ncbi:chymotrypsin-1-like [Trichogramma pretiosum]|uniref:chymotrypsin-1-like n=1 Tax=Trichogramma pretiosum TaxID=7493 RepID=UPI0006C9CE4F|nr:chymotrypsin-1-like [Trichogramma pretiosum]
MKTAIALLYFVFVVAVCSDDSDDSVKLRIINKGEVAKIGEFPYQVSFNTYGVSVCGGVLISPRHVLTAAHCVMNYLSEEYRNTTKNYYTIEVGSIKVGTGKQYGIKRMSHHKDFFLIMRPEPELVRNDIAMIHLNESVKFSKNVQAIAVPSKPSKVKDGMFVITSGFGQSASYYDGKLKYFYAKTVDCESSFKNRTYFNNICTKFTKGYGVCYGDSGGPLVDIRKKVLLGITSTSAEECASGVEPDVWVNVSYYLDFIREEMRHNATNKSSHPGLDIDWSTPPTSSGR